MTSLLQGQAVKGFALGYPSSRGMRPHKHIVQGRAVTRCHVVWASSGVNGCDALECSQEDVEVPPD